ncbi:MAG TPA: hypothetical protein VNG13_11930 [Mycobacteriales bacterium]|nr:hypothetical protein [Mycobacteriales bacterium]
MANRGRAPQTSRQRKLAAAQAAQRRAERRRRLLLITVGLVILGAIGTGVGIGVTSSPSSGPAVIGAIGPEQIPVESGPLIAPASTAATGQTIDGITCSAQEQVAYHIHAHLLVFVGGQQRQLPVGIGTVAPVVQQSAQGAFAQASRCYYWLHVHATDGIIHIESPTKRVFTLGNFFDIWRQPLGPSQVGAATGPVTAFVNGKTYTGNPAAIPLTAHEDIQLDVGSPIVAAESVDWSRASL